MISFQKITINSIELYYADYSRDTEMFTNSSVRNKRNIPQSVLRLLINMTSVIFGDGINGFIGIFIMVIQQIFTKHLL